MNFNQHSLEDWVEDSLSQKKAEQDIEFNELTQLTIVIPSYERQAFILRQVVYWGKTQAKIIILDGSQVPLSDRMQKVLAGLPNFTYRHLKESFAQRMKLAAEMIQTTYVAMLGDDEFFLKNGLCNAIKRLDVDGQLVACCGQPVGFNFSRFDNTVEYFDSYTTYWRYSISGRTVQHRLKKAIRTINSSTCYAVIRRRAWIEGWGKLQAWSSPGAMDIYQIIATCIYGNLICIDDLMWLRSSENSMIPDESAVQSAYDIKITFPVWWCGSHFACERDEFIGQLAQLFVSNYKLDEEDAKKIIKDVVCIYLELYVRGMHLTFSNMLRTGISNVLRIFFSSENLMAIKLFIFKILGRANQGIQGNSSVEGPTLSGRNLPIYAPAELKGIESMISGFYKAFK